MIQRELLIEDLDERIKELEITVPQEKKTLEKRKEQIAINRKIINESSKRLESLEESYAELEPRIGNLQRQTRGLLRIRQNVGSILELIDFLESVKAGVLQEAQVLEVEPNRECLELYLGSVKRVKTLKLEMETKQLTFVKFLYDRLVALDEQATKTLLNLYAVWLDSDHQACKEVLQVLGKASVMQFHTEIRSRIVYSAVEALIRQTKDKEEKLGELFDLFEEHLKRESALSIEVFGQPCDAVMKQTRESMADLCRVLTERMLSAMKHNDFGLALILLRTAVQSSDTILMQSVKMMRQAMLAIPEELLRCLKQLQVKPPSVEEGRLAKIGLPFKSETGASSLPQNAGLFGPTLTVAEYLETAGVNAAFVQSFQKMIDACSRQYKGGVASLIFQLNNLHHVWNEAKAESLAEPITNIIKTLLAQ